MMMKFDLPLTFDDDYVQMAYEHTYLLQYLPVPTCTSATYRRKLVKSPDA